MLFTNSPRMFKAPFPSKGDSVKVKYYMQRFNRNFKHFSDVKISPLFLTIYDRK